MPWTSGVRARLRIGRGRRARTIRFLPEFQTLSYAELWARVTSVAGGLRHGGLADTGSLVGLCGLGSPDWAVADFACLYLAAVSVPLQVSTAPADLKQIIHEAELSCIVTSLDQLELKPFTRENGLLTESNKPSRPRLKARYGERLEGLYAEIEQNQVEELQDLHQSAGRSAAEMVEKALEVTLGLRNIEASVASAPHSG